MGNPTTQLEDMHDTTPTEHSILGEEAKGLIKEGKPVYYLYKNWRYDSLRAGNFTFEWIVLKVTEPSSIAFYSPEKQPYYSNYWHAYGEAQKRNKR